MKRKARLAWLLVVLALACGAHAGAVWPSGRHGRRRGRSAHTVSQEAAPLVQQMVSPFRSEHLQNPAWLVSWC